MQTQHNPSSQQEVLATAMVVVVGSAMLFGHVVDAGAYSTDMAELSLCAWVGGVPHSPGYPLWTRLAELALLVQDSTDPIHALGRLSAAFAILTALFTRSILRSFAVGIWASSAAAMLLLVVPLFVRSFSIPEVYALDLLLLSITIWCGQKGSTSSKGPWVALGWATAILAIGHRPVNVILLATIAFGFRHIQDRPKQVLGGLAMGMGLQTILYADLWNRIQDPATLWIDEHAAATPDAFFRFVLGLPFEKFLSFSLIPANFSLSQMGIQCLLLMFMALLTPLVHRRSVIGWALMGMATWHVVFTLFYQVGDREFFLFPVLWTGILCLGLATTHVPKKLHTFVDVGFCVAVLALTVINQSGLAKPGHEQWRAPLRSTLQQVPKNAVLISDNWPARTALVAIREMENVGQSVDVVRISLEGGDIQRLDEWFDDEAPLIMLEERQEIDDLRPIRVHDDRLLPLLIERGLVTKPAEGSTWSVIPNTTPIAPDG